MNTASDWLLGLSDNPLQLVPSATTLDTQEVDLITIFRGVRPDHRRIVLVLACELADLR